MTMRNILTILALPLLISCGLFESNADQRTLEQNRDKWAAADGDSYLYQYRRLCFCPVEYAEWAAVRVLDEAILWVVLVNSGEEPEELGIGDYHTIEGLFEVAEDVIENADDYDISYDEIYGYPTRIEADYNKKTVDDEVTYEARYMEVYQDK